MKARSMAKAFLSPVLLALAACLPFGCLEGGTSTEAGNPGMVLGYEGPQGKVPFSGLLSIYVKDGTPDFKSLPPEDGSPRPGVQLGNYTGPASWLVTEEPATELCYEDLTHLINPHAAFALPKRSSASCASPSSTAKVSMPDMNVILFGSDGSVGALMGITYDTSAKQYRLIGEAAADTFWVKVDAGKDYPGTLKTSGLNRPPLALFVPGTPFFAPVLGDSFEFKSMPAGDYSLRLVTEDGVVYGVDSLHLKGDGAALSIEPGARVDSIALPPPVPVLETPTATPPGQFAFFDSVEVTLKAEPDAIIHYTRDGSTPTLASPVYDKPIKLYASTTIKAAAFLQKHKPSPVSVNNYVLVPPPPTSSPAPGTYRLDTLLVSLATSAKGATIVYTMDGSKPSDSSTVYAGPVKLTGPGTATLRAATWVKGLGLSNDTSWTYVLTP
jgi:hypothetical protein